MLALLVQVGFTFTVTANTAHAGKLKKGIERCVEIVKDDKRLACYDSVSGRADLSSPTVSDDSKNLLKEDSEPAESTDKKTYTEAIVADSPLPTNIGGKQFNKQEREPKQDTSKYSGQIVACDTSANNKLFFTFANGQIWKQVDTSRRRYRYCDFPAQIQQDRLGYKLFIDGNKSAIRIRRVR